MQSLRTKRSRSRRTAAWTICLGWMATISCGDDSRESLSQDEDTGRAGDVDDGDIHDEDIPDQDTGDGDIDDDTGGDADTGGYSSGLKDMVGSRDMSWTAWCLSRDWIPRMLEGSLSAFELTDMGELVKEWLYEERNNDLPE